MDCSIGGDPALGTEASIGPQLESHSADIVAGTGNLTKASKLLLPSELKSRPKSGVDARYFRTCRAASRCC